MRNSGVVLAPSKPFLLTAKFSNSFGSLPLLCPHWVRGCPLRGGGTQTRQSSAPSSSTVQVDRGSLAVSPALQGVAGGSGSCLTVFLSSPGRRYGSIDSAAIGRSDAESGSESSRRTSRQPSLESRRSLELSDRWVTTCAVCRVPRRVLCSLLAAVVRPTPVLARAAPCQPPHLAQGCSRCPPGPGMSPLGAAARFLRCHPSVLALGVSASTAACSLSCQRVWDQALGDSNATPWSWSPARVCLSRQKPHAVIWDPVMCQGLLSQLWPGPGWGGLGFPGVSSVSCIPVPQVLLPQVPG